jgi:selenium metabolism protein YedF
MTVLYLNSNMMGAGEPELGKKLLVLFLKKMAESDHHIDLVGCVNSGIFLTTEENEALDSLKKLAAKGARIATCGTCLDHYQRREKLLIGQVGSMDQTVEIFATADRIIRP